MSFFKFLNVSPPLSNVNGNLVNIDNSHSSALFTDTTNPKSVNPNALPEPMNKVQAAASYIPCNLKGGRRKKNISSMYKKMKGRKTRRHSSNRRRHHSKRMKTRVRRVRRTMKGGKWNKKGGMPNYPAGYSQYQNNLPMTQTYSLGAKLAANESALANPPPVKVLSNNTSCIDNYSRYTNNGFPSRGWW
jgi:hypothetical protein